MADRTRTMEREAYERHWLEQVRRGLLLTPVQRLAWLESTVEELSGWVGRARLGRPIAKDARQKAGQKAG